MGKLKNRDVYPIQQIAEAMNDIMSQRIPAALGMRLRKIKRTIETQVQDIDDERKRILALYNTGDDGKYSDADTKAINVEFEIVLDIEFECDQLSVAEVEKLELRGWTFASPLITDE